MFVVSRDELLCSTDGGRTYAVLSGGVFRSTDRGSSWQATAFANRSDITELVVSRSNATTRTRPFRE